MLNDQQQVHKQISKIDESESVKQTKKNKKNKIDKRESVKPGAVKHAPHVCRSKSEAIASRKNIHFAYSYAKSFKVVTKMS